MLAISAPHEITQPKNTMLQYDTDWQRTDNIQQHWRKNLPVMALRYAIFCFHCIRRVCVRYERVRNKMWLAWMPLTIWFSNGFLLCISPLATKCYSQDHICYLCIIVRPAQDLLFGINFEDTILIFVIWLVNIGNHPFDPTHARQFSPFSILGTTVEIRSPLGKYQIIFKWRHSVASIRVKCGLGNGRIPQGPKIQRMSTAKQTVVNK